MAYSSVDEYSQTSVKGECIVLSSARLGGSIVSVSGETKDGEFSMINDDNSLLHSSKKRKTIDQGDPRKSRPKGDQCTTEQKWCIIKLAFPGSIRGFDFDTRDMADLKAQTVSVDAVFCPDGNVSSQTEWTNILPKTNLKSSDNSFYECQSGDKVYTHVRATMHHGVVNRVHVHGTVLPQWPSDGSSLVDLAFVGNGGRVIDASNQSRALVSSFFLPRIGSETDNDMLESRGNVAGREEAVIRLGHHGQLSNIQLDTLPIEGSESTMIQIDAANVAQDKDAYLDKTVDWTCIVPQTTVVSGNTTTLDLVNNDKSFSHVKITVTPANAFSKVRIMGVRSDGSEAYHTPSEMTNKLTIEPLTPEAYLPYGDVIKTEKPDCRMTGANQGTAEKYHQVSKVINNFPNNSGRTNMCIFHCRPAKDFPFAVKLLERHPYSTQAFVPMAGTKSGRYLVLVALNGSDDRPDLSTLRAFLAPTTQGISYNPGVWHHPMIALDDETDFICFVHESGVPENDCNEVDIPPMYYLELE